MPLFGKFRGILRRPRHERLSDTAESDHSKEQLVVTVDHSDGMSNRNKNKKNKQNKLCAVEAELNITSTPQHTCNVDHKSEAVTERVTACNLDNSLLENTVQSRSPSPKSKDKSQHGSSPKLSPHSSGARSAPSAKSDLYTSNKSDNDKHTATTSLFREQKGEQYKRASDHELDPRRYSGRRDPAKGEAEVVHNTVASEGNFRTRLETKPSWISEDLEDSIHLLYCSVMDEMMENFNCGELLGRRLSVDYSDREIMLSHGELSPKVSVTESASGTAALLLLDESAQDLKFPKPGSFMTFQQYEKLQAAVSKVARSSSEGTAGHHLMSEQKKKKIQKSVSDGADFNSKPRTENEYQPLSNTESSKSQTETESTLDGISQLPSDGSGEVESLVQLSYLAFIHSREGLAKNLLGASETVCIGSDGRPVGTAAPCTVVEEQEGEMDGINLEYNKDKKASSTSSSLRRAKNQPLSSAHFRHLHDGKKIRCESHSAEGRCCMDLMAETCRVSNLKTDSGRSGRDAGSKLPVPFHGDFQQSQRTDQKPQGNQRQSGMHCLNTVNQTNSDNNGSSLKGSRFLHGRSLIPSWKLSKSKGKPVSNTSTSSAMTWCPNLITDSALCNTTTPECSSDNHSSLDESHGGHCLCCPLHPTNTDTVLFSDYLYLLRMHNYYVGRFDPIPDSLIYSGFNPQKLADPVFRAQLQALQSTCCTKDAVRILNEESVKTLDNAKKDVRTKNEGVQFSQRLKHEAVQTKLTSKHGKEREQQKNALVKEIQKAVSGHQAKERAASVQDRSGGTKDGEDRKKEEQAEERKNVRDEAVQTPRIRKSKRFPRPVEERPDRDDSPDRSARHPQQQLEQREVDDLEAIQAAYMTSPKLLSKHDMKSSEPSSPEQALGDDQTWKGRKEGKQNFRHQSLKLRSEVEGASAVGDRLEGSKSGQRSKQDASTKSVECCLETDQLTLLKDVEKFTDGKRSKQSAAQSPEKVYEELSKFSLELLETLEKGNLRWNADERRDSKQNHRSTERLRSYHSDKLLLCGTEDVEQDENVESVKPMKIQLSFAADIEHQKDAVDGDSPEQTNKLVSGTKEKELSDTREREPSDTRKIELSVTRKRELSDTRRRELPDPRKRELSDTREREPSGTRKNELSDTRKKEQTYGTEGNAVLACGSNSQQPCNSQGAGEKQCICCGEHFIAQFPTKRKSLKKSVEDMFKRSSKKQHSHSKKSSKASGDGSAMADVTKQWNEKPQTGKKSSRASTKKAVKRSHKSECAEHELQPSSKLVKTDKRKNEEGQLKSKKEQQNSCKSSRFNVADREKTVTKEDSETAIKESECPSDTVDASKPKKRPRCEKSKSQGDWAHSFPTHKVSKKIIAKLQATAKLLYLGNDVYAVKRKSLPLEVQQELKLKESARSTKSKDVVASSSGGKEGATVEDEKNTAQQVRKGDSGHKITNKHSSHRPEKIVVMSKSNLDQIRSQLGASKKMTFFRKSKKSQSAKDTSPIPMFKDAVDKTEAASSKPSSPSDKALENKSKKLLKLIRYLHSSKNKFPPRAAGSPIIIVPAFVSTSNTKPSVPPICTHILNSEKDSESHHRSHHFHTKEQKSIAPETVHQNSEKKGQTKPTRKSNKGSLEQCETEACYSLKKRAEASECPQVAQESTGTHSHRSLKQKRGSSKTCNDCPYSASKDSVLRSLISDILASLSHPEENEQGKKDSPYEKLKSRPSNRKMSDTFASDSDRPFPQQSPAFIPDSIILRKTWQGHSLSDLNTSQSQSESDSFHRMHLASTPLSMSENMVIVSDDLCLSSAMGDSVGFTCNDPCSQGSVKPNSVVTSISTPSSEVMCEGWQANRKKHKSGIKMFSAFSRLTTKPPLPRPLDTLSDEGNSVKVCEVPSNLRLISESDEGNGLSDSKAMAVDRFSYEYTSSVTPTDEKGAKAAKPVSKDNVEHGVLTSRKQLLHVSNDTSHAEHVSQSSECMEAPSLKPIIKRAPSPPLFKRNAHKVQSKTSIVDIRLHTAASDSHTWAMDSNLYNYKTSSKVHRQNDNSPVTHRRYGSLPVTHHRYNASPVTHHGYNRSVVSCDRCRRSSKALEQSSESPPPHDCSDRSPILHDRSDRPPISHDSDTLPISCNRSDSSPKSHNRSDISPTPGDSSDKSSKRHDPYNRSSIPHYHSDKSSEPPLRRLSKSSTSPPRTSCSSKPSSPVSDSSHSVDIHALKPPRGTSPSGHKDTSSRYRGDMHGRESLANEGRSASKDSLALGERKPNRQYSGQDRTKSRGERKSRDPFSSSLYNSSQSFTVKEQSSVKTFSSRTRRPVTYQHSESIGASKTSHRSLSRNVSDFSEYKSSVCSRSEQDDCLRNSQMSERAPSIKPSSRQQDLQESLEDIHERLQECSHKDSELKSCCSSYSLKSNSTSGPKHKSRPNVTCESSTSQDMSVFNSKSKSHKSKSEQSSASKSLPKHKIVDESDTQEEPENVYENSKSLSVDLRSDYIHTLEGSSPEVAKTVRSVSVSEKTAKRKSSASSVCSEIKNSLDALSECSDLKRSMDSIPASEKTVRSKSSGLSLNSGQRRSSVGSDQRRLLESTSAMEKAVKEKSSGSSIGSDNKQSLESAYATEKKDQRRLLVSSDQMKSSGGSDQRRSSATEKTVKRKSSASSVGSDPRKSQESVSAMEKTVKRKSSASSVRSDQKKSLDSIPASEKIEIGQSSLTSLHSDRKRSQMSLKSESLTESFHSHCESAALEYLQGSVSSQSEHKTLSDSSVKKRKSRYKKDKQVPVNPEQRKTSDILEVGECVSETTSKASKSTLVKSESSSSYSAGHENTPRTVSGGFLSNKLSASVIKTSSESLFPQADNQKSGSEEWISQKPSSLHIGLIQAKPSTQQGEVAQVVSKECSWLLPSPPSIRGSTIRAGTGFVPSTIPAEDSGKSYFHQATIKENFQEDQPYCNGLLSVLKAKPSRGDFKDGQQVKQVTTLSPSRIPVRSERPKSSLRSACSSVMKPTLKVWNREPYSSSKSRSPSTVGSLTPPLSNFVSPLCTSRTPSPAPGGVLARSPVYSTSPSFSLSPTPSLSPSPLQPRRASSEFTYTCSFSTTPTSSARVLTPHGYPSFSSCFPTQLKSTESVTPPSPFSVLSSKSSRIPRPCDFPVPQPFCRTSPSPRKLEPVEFTMYATPSSIISKSRSRSRSRSGSPNSGLVSSPSSRRKRSKSTDSRFPFEVRKQSKSPEIILTKTPSPSCTVPVISLASKLADRQPQDHLMFSLSSSAKPNSMTNSRYEAAGNRPSESVVTKEKNKARDRESKELRWKDENKKQRKGSSTSITDSKQTSSINSRSNPSATSRSTLQSRSSNSSSRSSFMYLSTCSRSVHSASASSKDEMKSKVKQSSQDGKKSEVKQSSNHKESQEKGRQEAERSKRAERPSRSTTRKIQKVSRETSLDSSESINTRCSRVVQSNTGSSFTAQTYLEPNLGLKTKLLFDVFK